jgi:hypothetical protein
MYHKHTKSGDSFLIISKRSRKYDGGLAYVLRTSALRRENCRSDKEIGGITKK